MAGPVYNAVWLFLCTLHPAYASFKAVKRKNVKEYVRWMMYWIVFALFSAMEAVLDPLLTFWLPFYSEVKVVLLLYLASPITRGSGVIYRRWVHPLLCAKEEEIDIVLEKVQEQGYNTAKTWVQRGVQWLGGMLVTTAIRVSVWSHLSGSEDHACLVREGEAWCSSSGGATASWTSGRVAGARTGSLMLLRR